MSTVPCLGTFPSAPAASAGLQSLPEMLASSCLGMQVRCLGTLAVPAWDACPFPAWERLPIPCQGMFASPCLGH